MIAKIISEYIKSNRRLILPSLGAFIRKDDTGEVVFVPFLKSDDGVFTSLLVNALAVSMADAQAMTEEFLLSVKQGVDQKGSFVIEGLGTITRDSNGAYTMQYNPNAVNAAAAPQVAQPAEPEVVAPNQETITDIIIEEAPQPTPRVAPVSVPVQVEIPEPEVKVEPKVQAEPEPYSNIVDLEIPEIPQVQPQRRVESKIAVQNHADNVDKLYSGNSVQEPVAPQNNPVAPKRNMHGGGPRPVVVGSRIQKPKKQATEYKDAKVPSKKAQNRKKMDIFMIVAIAAVIAGLLVILYGMIVSPQVPINLG